MLFSSQETCATLPESQILTESEPELEQEPPNTPHQNLYDTSRDLRLQIKTALFFKVPWKEIREKLGVSYYQIAYANHHRLTPQKKKSSRHALLDTPRQQELQQWLLASPSQRHIPWRAIPLCAPQFSNIGEVAITTAIQQLGYKRRKAIRKGFSDNPIVMRKRVTFAEQAKTWDRRRLALLLFSDKVWAKGGAHTIEWIIMREDGSNRYNSVCVQHKYSKQKAWMFWGSIIGGKKGPFCFWEKEWGNMTLSGYCEHILPLVELYIESHPGVYFQQDGTACHQAIQTREWLLDHHICWIKLPPYSPDLNLIEHVWKWMKDWIQRNYWQAQYDAAKLSLSELRRIILAAWEAVPDSFIESLFDL
jgi:hypothetical protein